VSRLDPAVAEVRNAVRGALSRALPGNGLVLVACSGGADSLALAAATRFVAPAAGLVTVDHQLQDGSAERAAALAKWAVAEGFDPVEVATVQVGREGGPEAAAREARYGALASLGRMHHASVLLGHTEDDQAETVLLALTRGSGPRGLAGMPAERELHGVRFLRPLLGVSRETCRAACIALGLSPWDDPHNSDPAYARSRLRQAMSTLVAVLGADVVPNLARSARQIGTDASYLDALADKALETARAAGGLDVARLEALPAALRGRVLHAWAVALDVPRAALSHRHVAALDALVTDWHGQGATQLPGGVSVRRVAGVLVTDSRS
jgi:tRNA(Ile)-lysidine synthase